MGGVGGGVGGGGSGGGGVGGVGGVGGGTFYKLLRSGSRVAETTMERNLVLRAVRRDGTINGSLSSSAVRDIVRRYGRAIGVPDLAPHDLRRTFSRLSRQGGAPMEVIQKSLGHASMRTTELYCQTGEEANAGDFLGL